MKKTLITGATGFVGGAVMGELLRLGVSIVTVVRKNSGIVPKAVKQIKISDISSNTKWMTRRLIL